MTGLAKYMYKVPSIGHPAQWPVQHGTRAAVAVSSTLIYESHSFVLAGIVKWNLFFLCYIEEN